MKKDKERQRYVVDIDLIGDVLLSRPSSSNEELYLDTWMGDVTFLSEEAASLVKRLSREEIDALPDELQGSCVDAELILGDEEGRFVPLERIDAITELTWMENFTHFVSNEALRKKLQDILDLSEMMKEFNKEVFKHRAEWDLWFSQLNSCKRVETERILAEHGVCEGPRFGFL